MIWSTIVIDRLLAFHTHIFDLGMSLERGWLIYHTSWTPYSFTKSFLSSALVFILSPITVNGDSKVLLILQTVMLAFSAFPIFFLYSHFNRNKLGALMLSGAYLIYFPLSGVNWYDFHYQAFFIPLFLLAVMLYTKKHFFASIIFFFLSGLVDYPYLAFPLLFALSIVTEEILNYRFHLSNYSKANLVRMLIFSIFLALVLAYSFILLHSSANLTGASGYNGQTFYLNELAFSSIDNKIFTICLLFFPLLGFPLFSKKWLVFLIPYLTLMFITNFAHYIFPQAFQYQYMSAVIPFLFIGTIDGIHKLTYKTENNSEKEEKRTNRALKEKLRSITIKNNVKFPAMVLVLVILFGLIYLPYGPLNKFSEDNFNFKVNTAVNTTLYDEMMQMINYIPNNDSNVLMQENLAQMLPRPMFDNSLLLIGGVDVAYNLTVTVNGGKTWIPLHPTYILIDPYNIINYCMVQSFPFNISMFKIVQKLYSSGAYGILAEASGLVLLKANYSSSLKYYVPYKNNFPAFDLYNSSTGLHPLQNIISIKDSRESLIWWGPVVPMSPGIYNITFEMKTNNVNMSNVLEVDVSAYLGKIVIYTSLPIYGENFSRSNIWSNFTIKVQFDNFYSQVEFRGYSFNWNGTLSVNDIRVNQISVAPST